MVVCKNGETEVSFCNSSGDGGKSYNISQLYEYDND